jgi:hypothetical protein
MNKPTNDEILKIKDFRDDGYIEAMRHAERILEDIIDDD